MVEAAGICSFGHIFVGRLRDKDVITSLNDRVLTNPEADVPLVHEAEDESVAVLADRAQLPADRRVIGVDFDEAVSLRVEELKEKSPA